MFKNIINPTEVAEDSVINVVIDGSSVQVVRGQTVAAAILASGSVVCRTTPKSNSPRGPYCMMGVCFECLVCIDNIASQQGCMVIVSEGMKIESQRGAVDFVGCTPLDDSIETSVVSHSANEISS